MPVSREPASLSVVLPCFNEEESIAEMYSQLKTVLTPLNIPYELLFVDDGSVDSTWQILSGIAQKDPLVRALQFSRNFGQQLAYRAGLDAAEGQLVITMDSDLQDPPSLIPSLIAEWRRGADIVYAQRKSRQHDALSKRFFASCFYRIIPKFTEFSIPHHVGEFRLMDRRVVEVIRTMNERRPFMRGMVAWTGYQSALVPYERPVRFAGVTKFPFRKSLALGLDAMVGFSSIPLKAALPFGCVSGGLAFLGLLLCVVVGAAALHFWSCFLWFLLSVHFIFLGVLGSYLSQIADQSNSRPLYIVASSLNARHAETK